jgi:glyoxylase-like metal-dependent hydrolase (beta-lactamase superfamily II)
MLTRPAESLKFPFSEAPQIGEVIEAAPGILWVRLKLPFRLNHVNIYLIEDGDGLAVVDTGIGNDATRAAWEQLLNGPLKGRKLTQLIVTHYHPDHIGLAGWMVERFGLPLSMSETEYKIAARFSAKSRTIDVDVARKFFREHGLDTKTTELVATRGLDYLTRVTGIPPTYQHLKMGDTIKIGGRDFKVLTGGGHSQEQVMLYCEADALFLAADQVLARISPNVSVHVGEADTDPLGAYIRSLDHLKDEIPPDVLVLPGHQMPFYGLHARASELQAHHAVRCGLIADAVRKVPRSPGELVPFVFHIELDPHQLSFAFSEVLAHVNYMLGRNELKWAPSTDGVKRVLAT